MITYLPFEEPLVQLKDKITEMKAQSAGQSAVTEMIAVMEEKYNEIEKHTYANLSPWDTVLVSRHPKRPQTRDYIALALDKFEELHGDRMFRDDLAIVTGLAQIGEHRIMLIGQHKGRDVNERHHCHAGCPHPEGYRKAQRKMELANRLGIPIVTLVDTKGAYPGIGSEQRGQGPALAEAIQCMAGLRVPVVCVVIGEGGSGGALAVGVGNKILMMQHAYYSVISPEGCASILWRDGSRKADAAKVLKLTGRDLLAHGFIDEIIEEPLGGAHRDPQIAAQFVRSAIINALDSLKGFSPDELREQRYQKFRAFGKLAEGMTIESVLEQWDKPAQTEQIQETQQTDHQENT